MQSSRSSVGTIRQTDTRKHKDADTYRQRERHTERQRDRGIDRDRDRQTYRQTDRQTDRDARRKSLFDWPVAFTKVILIVANCTLAKCSEEHKK